MLVYGKKLWINGINRKIVVTLRFIKYNEIKKIQNFLKKNWRSSILDKNKEFFVWTYCRKKLKNNNINFLVDIDDESNNIKACLGIIENRNFSDKKMISNTVWLTNWKSTKGSNLSGIKLLKFAELNLTYSLIGTIGCNELAKNIYKILGYKVGVMNRYVAINFKKDDFKILDTKTIRNFKFNLSESSNLNYKISIRSVKNINFLRLYEKKIFCEDRVPFKDISFVKNRYFNHPIYNYEFLLVESNENLVFIVLRKCYKDKSFAFRIVDILGEFNHFIKYANDIIDFLFKKDPEYIDLYTNKLIDKNLNKGSKLFEVSNYPELIIPSYFEPFVYSNPTINWAYKLKDKENKEPLLFKGDCDQDRPS